MNPAPEDVGAFDTGEDGTYLFVTDEREAAGPDDETRGRYRWSIAAWDDDRALMVERQYGNAPTDELARTCARAAVDTLSP